MGEQIERGDTVTPKKGDTVTPKKEWQTRFLRALATRGNVADACRRAKISRQHAYRTREEDEAFATAWDESLTDGIELLEGEAFRRAKEGTLRPVFHQGKKVGTVREYSDTLLIFLLKANKPAKYRERVEHTGADGGPIETRTTVTIYVPDNSRGDRG